MNTSIEELFEVLFVIGVTASMISSCVWNDRQDERIAELCRKQDGILSSMAEGGGLSWTNCVFTLEGHDGTVGTAEGKPDNAYGESTVVGDEHVKAVERGVDDFDAAVRGEEPCDLRCEKREGGECGDCGGKGGNRFCAHVEDFTKKEVAR